MNCKEVDNIWRTFASKNNLEIEVSNDNYFYGIKTKYFIVLNTESPKIVLEGLVNKNNQGYNLHKTKIRLEDVNISKFDFKEVVNIKRLGLFKNQYKDNNKANLLKILRKFGANRIKIADENGIAIEFNYLFEKEEEFLKLNHIIKEITKACH